MNIPTFITVAQHDAIVAGLRARIAELEQRPLIAVAPDVAELQAENTKLRERLQRVRELLREKMQEKGEW